MPTDAAREIQALIDEDDATEEQEPTYKRWLAVPLDTLVELLAEHRKMYERRRRD